MSRKAAGAGRRPHGGMRTTRASEAPCKACRRPVLHAWDEGLLVRADAVPLDEIVVASLRALDRSIYALTEGGWLVHETAERELRLVRSRHVVHACPAPKVAPVVHEQLEIFDHVAHPPAHGNGGLW